MSDLFVKCSVAGIAERRAPGESAPHTVYLLRVELGEHHRWHIERRYNAFKKLQKSLARGGAARLLHGASLPRPVWFSNRSPRVIRERRAALQQFMTAVLTNLRESERGGVLPPLAKFLSIPRSLQTACDTLASAKLAPDGPPTASTSGSASAAALGQLEEDTQALLEAVRGLPTPGAGEPGPSGTISPEREAARAAEVRIA
jgi:hypothetical protein